MKKSDLGKMQNSRRWKNQSHIFDDVKIMSVTEAMKLSGLTRAGVIVWIKKYNLGKKLEGAWIINRERFQKLLKSREDVINGKF